MKNFIVLLVVSLLATSMFAQKKAKLNLTNALVVGQLDDPDDRYSLEINLTQLLVSSGIIAESSLNYMKFGEDSKILGEDSIKRQSFGCTTDRWAIRSLSRKYRFY